MSVCERSEMKRERGGRGGWRERSARERMRESERVREGRGGAGWTYA